MSAAHLITYPGHNAQKTHSKVLDSILPEETVQTIQVIRTSETVKYKVCFVIHCMPCKMYGPKD